MSRDWDAEETELRTKAVAAFECLMGIRSVGAKVQTRRGEAAARYVVDEAQEAYGNARAEIDAWTTPPSLSCDMNRAEGNYFLSHFS